jgi:hypothetical protein
MVRKQPEPLFDAVAITIQGYAIQIPKGSMSKFRGSLEAKIHAAGYFILTKDEIVSALAQFAADCCAVPSRPEISELPTRAADFIDTLPQVEDD